MRRMHGIPCIRLTEAAIKRGFPKCYRSGRADKRKGKLPWLSYRGRRSKYPALRARGLQRVVQTAAPDMLSALIPARLTKFNVFIAAARAACVFAVRQKNFPRHDNVICLAGASRLVISQICASLYCIIRKLKGCEKAYVLLLWESKGSRVRPMSETRLPIFLLFIGA